MEELFDALAHQPLLVLTVAVGVGALLGRISVRGVTLGAAAVLFVAMALNAWAVSWGSPLEIPEVVGYFGLAIFAFAIGITSGPNFFHALRRAWPLMVVVAAALVLAALVAVLLGGLFGLDDETVAGTFAGAVTNTPALAAAGGTPAATVGYSVSYIFGLVGMLLVVNMGLRHRHRDTDAPSPLVDLDVRVERDDDPAIADIEEVYGRTVRIAHIRREETGPAQTALRSDVLRRGDVVTVVGPEADVRRVADDLGHASSHRLAMDRRHLDFRRITVSDPTLAGRTVSQLQLEDRFQATISRVRRGDVDMVGAPDLVLQLGDRVRVVAPTSKMTDITAYLGDSARGLSDINPAALGVGLALGLLLGHAPIPVPGGEPLTIGAAAGTLLVGLVMGRVGRIGPVVTALPYTACAVLSELGLLVFLAFAGTRAGSQITAAFTSGAWIGILVTGAAVTLTLGLVVLAVVRHGFHVGGTRISGLLAGVQTQPALLAYANGRTAHDPRVALGYAMVYPTAMVVKILIAQVVSGA